MAHELMDVYSDIADARLRASLVTRDNLIVSPRFEGSARGRAVRIPVRDLEAKVKEYNKITGAPLEGGESSYLDVLLDHDQAVNELIDGYDAMSAPDDIIADRIDSGAYALALALDQYTIETLEACRADGNANVSKTTTAATKDNAFDLACEAMTYHNKIHVPNDGRRWLIASPEYYAALLNDNRFIRSGDLPQQLLMQGVLGQVVGYNVVMSANLKTDFIAGHPNWCHRPTVWIEDVKIANLTNTYIGASAVQGRLVYAVKVSKPKTVFVKTIA